MKTLFKNYIILKNGRNLGVGDIAVDGEYIVEPGLGFAPDRVYDGKGRLYLSAGLIDIHIHGAGGYDFMDAVPDEYIKIAECAAEHGTTALYPTLLCASDGEMEAAVAVYEQTRESKKGAAMLGLHFEGPFLSPLQSGALDPEYIRKPEPEIYKKYFAMSDHIARMTVAPEIEGAAELGVYMREHGIIGSIGHTDALFEDCVRAHDEGGYKLMTHLYSAMSHTRRINAFRHGGAVEAGYYFDDMYVELIADGKHLPKEILALAYKFKRGRIVLVTDAMRAAGTDVEESILGSRRNGQQVFIEDGVAKMPDRLAFAGSIATADHLIRTMIDLAGVSVAEAVRMMTETAAEAMKIPDRGFLEPGMKADIILFDEGINIKATVRDGSFVYGSL
ncbi:MAG: N-acetylglucosamine-6-phosphate deacetylase [Clostridia bacterium]|nr:N-acetylglucosamine-6-phosphate deacetylase [Clostridia bacterium]